VPDLILRNISDTLYSLLKQKAKMHKRSMDKQAISLLELSLLPPPKLSLKNFPKPLKPMLPIDDAFIQKAISRSHR
jgi:hypothetical protein